jgi:hypothetical protein
MPVKAVPQQISGEGASTDDNPEIEEEIEIQEFSLDCLCGVY